MSVDQKEWMEDWRGWSTHTLPQASEIRQTSIMLLKYHQSPMTRGVFIKCNQAVCAWFNANQVHQTVTAVFSWCGNCIL